MPWLDTLSAVHMALAMRPRSSDFSKWVEAACSAARPAGPSAPWPEGERASRLKQARGMATKAVPDPLAEELLHEVQRVLLPRDILALPALARAPAQGGRRAERVPHRARPGKAAPRFPDSLGEDLGDSRPPGHTGQPEEPLVPRVHDRGDKVPVGKDGEDNLLGPGQARGPPQGPHNRGFQPPQVGFHHRRDGHTMERKRGDQRADSPLPTVIGREVGEAAKGAPSRFQAPGQHRPRDPRAPNGDVDAELAESRRQRDPGSREQDGRGALFPLDPGARFVHADVLSRDLQPLLRRGDRLLEGGRA